MLKYTGKRNKKRSMLSGRSRALEINSRVVSK
jgi:hypothetical protein